MGSLGWVIANGHHCVLTGDQDEGSDDESAAAPAYFAADVIWTADTQSFGATGAIGVTHVTTPVPEPETYALFLAGLGAMGFMARRRRKTA